MEKTQNPNPNPILDRFQKNFGFCLFSIRSFKFWVRRMVSFRRMTVYFTILTRRFLTLLPTMLSPSKNKADAEKAPPRLFKKPSMTSGNFPPKMKFPTIPKTVIKMIGFVHTPLITLNINVILDVFALFCCCCFPISMKTNPTGFKMTKLIGATKYK